MPKKNKIMIIAAIVVLCLAFFLLYSYVRIASNDPLAETVLCWGGYLGAAEYCVG